MKTKILLLFIGAALILSGCDIIPDGPAPHSNENDILSGDYEVNDTETSLYGVYYDGNGHDGGAIPVDDRLYEKGDAVLVLSPDSLELTDYIFSGWNTGTGKFYPCGSSFYIGGANVVLRAYWVRLSYIPYRDLQSLTGATFTQTDTYGNSFSHTVSDFSIGVYEVTYRLWHTVYQWALSNGYAFSNRGREGSEGTEGEEPADYTYRNPVTGISWRDAIVWCNAYSEMSGYSPVYRNQSGLIIRDSTWDNAAECNAAVPLWTGSGYRLATEGEWQFAAGYIDGTSRTPPDHASGALTDTMDTADLNPANGIVDGKEEADRIAVYGYYYDGSAWSPTGVTEAAGIRSKSANQAGLYDMSGNVAELCWDCYANYPSTPQTDYRGGSDSYYRLVLGGGWKGYASELAIGRRESVYTDLTDNLTGFRLARTP